MIIIKHGNPSYVIEKTIVDKDGELYFKVMWQKSQGADCSVKDALRVLDKECAKTNNRLELWYKSKQPLLLAWRGVISSSGSLQG